MNSIDAWNVLAIGTTSLLLFVVLYVWAALALSAVFRKSGEEGWKAWVPFLNLAVLLQLGGLSGWLVLLILVPVVGQLIVWLLLIVAYHRINVAFGHGAGMTVVAALVMPVWASILGFGPARWLGSDQAPAARRTPLVAQGGGPHRSPSVDDGGASFVPRVAPRYGSVPPPAYGPVPQSAYGAVPSVGAVPPPAYGRAAAPVEGWTPPPVPPTAPLSVPARPAAPASARPAEPVIPPVPPLPSAAASDSPSHAQAEPPIETLTESPARRSAPPFVQPPAGTAADPQPATKPVEPVRSTPDWGGFDLGAVSEVTSEVTAADSAAPAPISAVPLRPAPDAAVTDPPLVTRIPAAPAVPATDEPWAPARSPMPDPGAFSDTSGQVSAIAGAPDAGTPRSALGAVSAQYKRAEIPEDPIDETIITRRRRTPWSLVPPSGAAIAITSEVVIVGRKPDHDGAFPAAQLVAIDDGTVSKTHARLALREDRWYVTDLGSTNGVLFATLMGTEVAATPGVEIEAGERFFLGDAEVRLQRSDR